MFEVTRLLAMSPQAGEQPSIISMVMPFVLVFGVMYFLMIAPQRKKQKAHEQMIANLKPGDKVITGGGIHGIVVGVQEGIVQLRIADQVKIEVSRSAVTALKGPADE